MSSSGNGPSEYIASLLSEISALRDEVAAVYRTQSQNAQRLLSMTETLRDKEEMLRIESENVRKARDEVAHLRRKVEQHDEIVSEKDRGVQVRLPLVAQQKTSKLTTFSCVDPSRRNSSPHAGAEPSCLPKRSFEGRQCLLTATVD